MTSFNKRRNALQKKYNKSKKIKNAVDNAGIPQAQWPDVKVKTERGEPVYFYKTSNDVLSIYCNRGYITMQQMDAGKRLYEDFFVAGIELISSSRFSDVKGSSLQSFTDAQLDARDRYRKALEAIGGIAGKYLLEHVCCYGRALNDMDALQFPVVIGYKNVNARMARFKEAIADLEAHYYGRPKNMDLKYYYRNA